MNKPMFTRAGRAEILRAAQKDEEFCDQFQNKISDFVGEVAGQRLWITRHNVVQNLAGLSYKTFTTLMNRQTLGEEYTSIIQVDKTGRNLPSKWKLVLSVLLESGGSLLTLGLLRVCEEVLKHPRMKPDWRARLNNLLAALKTISPLLQQLHKTMFYCYGSYYHFAKRFVGIQHVLVRSWLKDYESRPAFRLLGVISSVYLGLLAFHTLCNRQSLAQNMNISTSAQQSVSSSCSDSTLRCSLCLEPRTDTSCTPCGHLFCWNCIHEWLLSKPECPLCRERVQPCRVVRLQNYQKAVVEVSKFL